MDMKISPSILASDYANLQSELDRIKSSDLIHVDVMDGHFVPNICRINQKGVQCAV